MYFSGKARLAGVMGWPVGHSRSPRLHNFWLQKYGLDGAYVPLNVDPQNFATAVQGLAALGFQGANVTVPHKEAALAALDDITPLARRIGAVNTLILQDNGRFLGDNSDGFGFIENIRQESPEAWSFSQGPAVVLGAGGAAKGLCVALIDAGCPEIRIVNRTVEKAEALVSALKGAGETTSLKAFSWEDRQASFAEAALLVNATSLGMTGQAPLQLSLQGLPEHALVNDIVYAPLETDLLKTAKARGHAVVDGLGMLLHQARPGFEAWFGLAPEVDQALRDHILADL